MAGEIRHFGIVTAEIDDQSQRVRLVLKRYGRGSQQLMTGEVVKVIDWALQSVTKEYPGYVVNFEASTS